MVDEKIVNRIKKYLERMEQEGMAVDFSILYGSYARGQADPLSDIDLIVVSPAFDPVHRREDIRRLWRIAAEIDNRIEPVPCGKKEWEQDDWQPLLEIARREGIKVGINKAA
jgi:predicted nucleotidyltransferase